MRLNLAAIVMLGLPALAAAQTAAPAPGSVPPLPSIGVPLPQIGIPHPPTGLPAPDAPQRRATASRPPTRARRPHGPGSALVPVYVYPYPYDLPAGAIPSQAGDASVRPPQPLAGRLLFDVAAGGGEQLYVDGFYAGTLSDFANGVELEAGPHAVEIRAPEFETLSFAVNIAPGQAMTYRGTLKAIAPRPDAPVLIAPPIAPARPMVGYIVPGCYIGNVPPQDAGLPASCDLSRTITIQP
jgi:hypothetical protein